MSVVAVLGPTCPGARAGTGRSSSSLIAVVRRNQTHGARNLKERLSSKASLKTRSIANFAKRLILKYCIVCDSTAEKSVHWFLVFLVEVRSSRRHCRGGCTHCSEGNRHCSGGCIDCRRGCTLCRRGIIRFLLIAMHGFWGCGHRGRVPDA